MNDLSPQSGLREVADEGGRTASATGVAAGGVTIALPMIGGNNWLGGENYVRNILHCLSSLPPAEQPKVRITSILNANPELVRSSLKFSFVKAHPIFKWALDNRWARAVLSIAIRVLRILRGKDYNLEYKGVDVIFPQMQYNSGDRRFLYWISDFQELHLPDLFSQRELHERHENKRSIVESSQFLVLSSNAALHDLHSNYEEVNARVRVWRFCSSNDKSCKGRNPCDAFGVPSKYIYVANQFWAHKNHRAVIEALGILKSRGVVIPLVCTGSSYEPRSKDHYDKLMKMLSDFDVADQTHLLGIVAREDQIQLMRHAAFVVQPSFFEGWSTVVEDAISLGRPIVLSNLKVHVEQDPPRVLYFDPSDSNDLAEKLLVAWNRFPAGPDAEAELEAERQQEQRRLDAGRALMSILEEAAQIAGSSR